MQSEAKIYQKQKAHNDSLANACNSVVRDIRTIRIDFV